MKGNGALRTPDADLDGRECSSSYGGATSLGVEATMMSGKKCIL